MNKVRPFLLLALACCVLAACASLAGPRDIDLPLARLQAGLDRRFPMQNRAFELFDIELARPRISVLPHSGRVAIALDATMAPPFLRQSYRGRLALSGRLYIDQARSAVMMTEPMVEGFTLSGVDSARQRELTRVANILMNRILVDVPLYQFRTEDLQVAGVRFVPTSITTTARGLTVSVAPAH